MHVLKVLVELGAEEKIFKKHGVSREEIENALLAGRPLFFKTRGRRYLAITCHLRHLTIVFSYSNGYARVITAYPSSCWQARLYGRK